MVKAKVMEVTEEENLICTEMPFLVNMNNNKGGKRMVLQTGINKAVDSTKKSTMKNLKYLHCINTEDATYCIK